MVFNVEFINDLHHIEPYVPGRESGFWVSFKLLLSYEMTIASSSPLLSCAQMQQLATSRILALDLQTYAKTAKLQ